METTTKTSTVYYVRVLGHIWQPGVGPCAMEYQVRDVMEYPQAEGETAEEYEIRIVQCATETGDFSEITAWEIERADTYLTVYSERIRKTETEWTTILAFTDDERMTWDDIIFGGGFEEES